MQVPANGLIWHGLDLELELAKALHAEILIVQAENLVKAFDEAMIVVDELAKPKI